MKPEHAKQIAELLNSENHLIRGYKSEMIPKRANDFICELEDDIVIRAFRVKIKRFIMASKLKNIFAVIFMLLLFSVSALACTCTYGGIKSKGFSGQIFAVSPDKQLPDFNSPLSKATVKLLKRTDDGDTVIAEIIADESGRFSLENIKPGKYFLQVESNYFSPVFVQLKISGGSRKKDKIIIALAPGMTCCEGYAKVQKAGAT